MLSVVSAASSRTISQMLRQSGVNARPVAGTTTDAGMWADKSTAG